MANSRELYRRLARLHEATQEQLLSIEDAAGKRLYRIADDLIETARRLLDEGGLSNSRAASLVNSLDIMIGAATDRGQRLMRTGLDAVFDVALESSTLSLATFETITPRALFALANNFDATFRPDLRQAAHNEWLDKLPGEAFAPVSGLRDILAESVIKGTDSFTAARQFIERDPLGKPFSQLPEIRQSIDPAFRAARLVRTELGRINNVTSITFSETAGVENFYNLGVGDNRQSEVCRFASRQKPLSVEKWNALRFTDKYGRVWIVGVGPRHPHCRCLAIGVPAGVTVTVPEDLAFAA